MGTVSLVEIDVLAGIEEAMERVDIILSDGGKLLSIECYRISRKVYVKIENIANK